DGKGLPEVRALVRGARSEELQLQLATGLVPALPRVRRAVLSARRGPRRARGRHRGIVVWLAGGGTGDLSGLRWGKVESAGAGGEAANGRRQTADGKLEDGAHH